ncbi:MAG TPA: cytochrome c maturation protein CcmE [Caldisericia bacterium]|nr:MAG: Cytochrome c-type biogenesis protein CcmE [bacterium ADurb.Bin132]HNY61461.1 cytochrome c maturation protein CcmE [Caldisericia bacterium]HOC79901.1 cytochrome c maturation protein CcmE [Caldisericia bacterium]HOG70464.1 cytochrome c maturation protein CcmE [Caldisericia bacterium]HPA65841.1 cytochrome c maturation protein CcmE [Caldisericia bacterium]
MNRKVSLLIGIIAIAVLSGVSIWFFLSSMTPFTSDFSEAKSGKAYQVYGVLDQKSLKQEGNLNYFNMVDEKGEVLPVILDGVLPQNFAGAQKGVAIGSFKDGSFHAEQLLVKCPSKYENKDGKESGGSGK